MEDEKIIELYFERSEDAIRETDRKYGVKCRSTAYNILQDREDSEECTNDTYLRLWNVIPPQRPSPLLTYIMRIVRNLALDRVRRAKASKRADDNYRAVYDEIKDMIPAPDSVTKTVEGRELSALIDRFLAEQSREKRAVFLMRYWNFCSVSEIAQRLGIGESKVMVTLMRTRNKLKEFLEKEGVDI